jgi:hypothetical protein
MGRKRRNENCSPQKSNSMGNEENGYPVPEIKKKGKCN